MNRNEEEHTLFKIVNEVHIGIYLRKIRKQFDKYKVKEVTLVACGASIINLLLISDILSEQHPSLFRLNMITYDKCLTCQAKTDKHKLPIKSIEELKVQGAQKAGEKPDSLIHHCKN